MNNPGINTGTTDVDRGADNPSRNTGIADADNRADNLGTGTSKVNKGVNNSGMSINKPDKETDNSSTGTGKANKGVDNLGTGTKKVDRGANNPDISIDKVDGGVDDQGTKTADINIANNLGIDADGAINPGIDTNRGANKQAAASNKPHASLFSLRKALFILISSSELETVSASSFVSLLSQVTLVKQKLLSSKYSMVKMWLLS